MTERAARHGRRDAGPRRRDRAGTPARQLHEVAPGVWTAVAELWASRTTVVVGAAGGCLVVDPGISVAEVDGLAVAMREHGWHAAVGFSTHAHWDHQLWSAALGDVPRWATARATAHASATHTDSLTRAEKDAPGHDAALLGRLTALPDGAVEVPWDGPHALVVAHDAHSPGHAGLVLPEAHVLLGGDMLSDLEIPLLDADAIDPIGDYRIALNRLESAARSQAVHVLVPGHGHLGDADELARRLAADRSYLDGLVTGTRSSDPRLTT